MGIDADALYRVVVQHLQLQEMGFQAHFTFKREKATIMGCSCLV